MTILGKTDEPLRLCTSLQKYYSTTLPAPENSRETCSATAFSWTSPYVTVRSRMSATVTLRGNTDEEMIKHTAEWCSQWR